MKEKLYDYLFSPYKWYRKKKGGTWYKIRDVYPYSGFTGVSEYWIRAGEKIETGQEIELIKMEIYENRTKTKINSSSVGTLD